MMIENCKKCGGRAIAKYNGCSDKMDFRCGCGYRWSAPPLDRQQDARSEVLKRLAESGLVSRCRPNWHARYDYPRPFVRR